MDYQKEMEKLGIDKNQYPYYDNPDNFASRFKKCTIYEYGNITYSDTSSNTADTEDPSK